MAAFTAEVGNQRSEVGGRKSDEARQFGDRKSEVGAEPADDAGEETAAIATADAPSQSTEPNGAPPPPDEEGFVWPEGAAPSESFAASASGPESDAAPTAPLPSLDELVQRIPAVARETLDELFRAKFVAVKRVDLRTLKN